MNWTSALITASLAAAGCGDRRNDAGSVEADTQGYVVQLWRWRDDAGHNEWYPDVTLDGATLLADGEPQGELTDWTRVHVKRGRTFHDGKVVLALRLPTPCGVREVPLPYTSATSVDEELHTSLREPKIVLRRDRGMTLPGGVTNVYVDDEHAPKAVVRFGSHDIPARPRIADGEPAKGRYQRLWDLPCAPTHDVTIDGAKVGVARADAPGAIGFLIATDPQACYQRRIAVYSNDPNFHSKEQRFALLRGQVNATGWDGIHAFLEAAPTAVRDDYAAYGATHARRSLERVPCEPAAP